MRSVAGLPASRACHQVWEAALQHRAQAAHDGDCSMGKGATPQGRSPYSQLQPCSGSNLGRLTSTAANVGPLITSRHPVDVCRPTSTIFSTSINNLKAQLSAVNSHCPPSHLHPGQHWWLALAPAPVPPRAAAARPPAEPAPLCFDCGIAGLRPSWSDRHGWLLEARKCRRSSSDDRRRTGGGSGRQLSGALTRSTARSVLGRFYSSSGRAAANGATKSGRSRAPARVEALVTGQRRSSSTTFER